MITEIFVSIDGNEYTKLDLFKNETIQMKYTVKDLQDISKVFSPYSLNFTFEGTPKNRLALGFFGDTDALKANTESKYFCKIYTNGSLNMTGFLIVQAAAYKNLELSFFTASFATTMTNLKDRIGDTLISDLATLPVLWKPSEVESLMKSKKNAFVSGANVQYFVPLISSTRVWSCDPTYTAGLKDNIAYNAAYSATNENLIKTSDLRPAISFSSLIELIKNKYNLTVIAPIDTLPEYKDAFVWCNSESIFSTKETRLEIQTGFVSIYAVNTKNEGDILDPKKYVPTANIVDKSFSVTRQQFQNEWDSFFTFQLYFENIIVTAAGSNTPSVIIKTKRIGTNEVLTSNSFDITSTTLDCLIQMNDSYLISNKVDFYVTVQFNQPTSWGNMKYDIYFRYYDGKYGPFNSKRYATYVYESTVNNNSDIMAGTKIDLFKTLPPIKVVDLLKSYFSLFNINIYDSSPFNDDLFWLTPNDVDNEGLEYSKATVDYTKYNPTLINKSTSSDFNSYNFKHAKSNYKSNVDYFSQFGLEYGQAKFPLVQPKQPIEFKVETSFTLMVPVILAGTDDVITYYGFDSSSPDTLETGENRYNTNYGELTLFYLNGSKSLKVPFGIQSQASNGVLLNSKLSTYLQVLPFNTNGDSLAFSVIKLLNVEYPNSIYKRYYQKQTERLLDPNVLTQSFKINLPPDELYLNNATSTQGNSKTPVGFRLQNDVVIGENRFSFIDATIDQTTGDATLTLLNY